jgi:hypothetical protein
MMVLAAAIHTALQVCGWMAAGLDEIREPAPVHRIELEARGQRRVLPASVRPIMPSRRRSPSQLDGRSFPWLIEIGVDPVQGHNRAGVAAVAPNGSLHAPT